MYALLGKAFLQAASPLLPLRSSRREAAYQTMSRTIGVRVKIPQNCISEELFFSFAIQTPSNKTSKRKGESDNKMISDLIRVFVLTLE